MTSKLITACVFSVLLAAGSAAAQSTGGTPGNIAGGGTGATTGPGNTSDNGGSTVNGKPLDTGTTGSTQSEKAAPPNNCDPAKAANNASQPNQNNASSGCVN